HQGLKAVHPAGTAAPSKGASAYRTGVFNDLKLGVLAVGNDVLGIELTVGDELGDGVHHLGIRSYGVGSNDVHVRQPHCLRHRLTAGQEFLPLIELDVFEELGIAHACALFDFPLVSRLADSFLPTGTVSPGTTSMPVPVTKG